MGLWSEGRQKDPRDLKAYQIHGGVQLKVASTLNSCFEGVCIHIYIGICIRIYIYIYRYISKRGALSYIYIFSVSFWAQ